MGLLADYQALPADQQQLATLNGNVTGAQAALDAAKAAVDAQQVAINNDVAKVVADLSGPPYNGKTLIPGADMTTWTILTVAPPANPGDQPGLSAQSVVVAS